MEDIFKKRWSNSPNNHKKPNTLNNINGLNELKELINSQNDEIFTHLKSKAKNIVFSSGWVDSPLMIIGEAPGAKEDELGLPFVGDAGDLLNKMLKAIDINRDRVYVTNVVNWRPENNTTPTKQQIDAFRPFLMKHIDLQKPKVIFVLGSIAMSALNIPGPISTSRGKIHILNGIPVFLTFHPAYLMRNPVQAKPLTWKDLQLLKQELENLQLLDLLKST